MVNSLNFYKEILLEYLPIYIFICVIIWKANSVKHNIYYSLAYHSHKVVIIIILIY